MKKVYPIIEGHGEVAAAPILLRRLLAEAQCPHIGVGRPIKRTQAQLRGKETVQAAVQLARLQPACSAVLILFDGEDDCPMQLADRVRGWAREAAAGTPCDVVVAYREYETWFLATIESLRGRCGIRDDALAPDNPDSRRNAKGVLETFMPLQRAYSETGDQPALTAAFDMAAACRRSRSFRKLATTVGDLLTQLQEPLPAWPPREWQPE